jgi:hypothetical protein
MRKRFIVMVDKGPENAEEKFKNWIGERKLGWWHWIDGAWFLVGTADELTPSDVRDAVRECYGPANCMVLEVKGNRGKWAGFGPKTDNDDMFAWFLKNWKED